MEDDVGYALVENGESSDTLGDGIACGGDVDVGEDVGEEPNIESPPEPSENDVSSSEGFSRNSRRCFFEAGGVAVSEDVLTRSRRPLGRAGTFVRSRW